MSSTSIMSKIAQIEKYIKEGNLWNGQILKIGKKYMVVKKVFHFEIGTTFIFYGFGCSRFDSETVICIHLDGDAEPTDFFFSANLGINPGAEFEACVQSVDVSNIDADELVYYKQIKAIYVNKRISDEDSDSIINSIKKNIADNSKDIRMVILEAQLKSFID